MYNSKNIAITLKISQLKIYLNIVLIYIIRTYMFYRKYIVEYLLKNYLENLIQKEKFVVIIFYKTFYE